MNVTSPTDLASRLRQAVVAHQNGDFAVARGLYEAVLAGAPANFDALHLSGVLEAQHGNLAGAIERMQRAIAVDPGIPAAHLNLGNALRDLGRGDEALASYDRALALTPEYPQALINRGNVLALLGRASEAVASFDRALALQPNVDALVNRGIALQALGRHETAAESQRRALALAPSHAEAAFHLGNALAALKRYDDAIAAYDRALAVNSEYAAAHNNRGNALAESGRPDEAIAAFDRALALKPDDAETHYNRGNALERLGRDEDAVASFGRALARRPEYAEALYNRGIVLRNLRRPDESAADFERLVAIEPDHPYAVGNLLHSKLHACDWSGYAALVDTVTAAVRAGKPADLPFPYLSVSDSPDDLLTCARSYAAARFTPTPEPLWRGERYVHDRIRVAYLSADFHDHATARLIAELLERHDRARFDITAISYGVANDDPMRRRLLGAFDRFVDVRALDDRAAAEKIRRLEIDIAVDLKGYTRDSRPGILTHRAAPVQATYLGFPGGLGIREIDYIIADKVTIPESHDVHYDERVVRLPDCYQPTDTKRRVAERTPTREEVGLPDDAFVFCCFNNNYKVTPDVFDVWMRLLARVPGSVLWLFTDNPAAVRNLRNEAESRSIDPTRLVFATRASPAEHLARHRLADLFLDTVPINAHTTASDALWMGLPVVTILGGAFVGRVAASLLSAAGMPELATGTLAEYETLALTLATDPAALATAKTKLARNRLSQPLFDTDRLRRHLERAYVVMHERSQRGEPPASFTVPPIAN